MRNAAFGRPASQPPRGVFWVTLTGLYVIRDHFSNSRRIRAKLVSRLICAKLVSRPIALRAKLAAPNCPDPDLDVVIFA